LHALSLPPDLLNLKPYNIPVTLFLVAQPLPTSPTLPSPSNFFLALS
jgi:hypothetical protein